MGNEESVMPLNSNDVKTSVWGPEMWRRVEQLIEYCTDTPKGARTVLNTISHLDHLLRCSICRSNYPRTFMAVYDAMTPQILQNVNKGWLHVMWWTIHNAVNRRLDKPRYDWSEYARRFPSLVSGKWQAQLSNDDLRLFKRLTHPTFVLGYFP